MTTELMAIAFRMQELEGQLKEAINRKFDCLRFLETPSLAASQVTALTNVFKTNDISQGNIRTEIRQLSNELSNQ